MGISANRTRPLELRFSPSVAMMRAGLEALRPWLESVLGCPWSTTLSLDISDGWDPPILSDVLPGVSVRSKGELRRPPKPIRWQLAPGCNPHLEILAYCDGWGIFGTNEARRLRDCLRATAGKSAGAVGILNYCRTKVRFGVVKAVNGNIRMLINRGRGCRLHARKEKYPAHSETAPVTLPAVFHKRKPSFLCPHCSRRQGTSLSKLN
jgi:hypothetical protein